MKASTGVLHQIKGVNRERRLHVIQETIPRMTVKGNPRMTAIEQAYITTNPY